MQSDTIAEFVWVWAAGYRSPTRFITGIRTKPAPHWGVTAQIVRGLLDGVGLYLPLTILGRSPSTPSALTLLPTDQYYAASVILAPVFLLLQWLMLCALLHVILRVTGRPSDIDQILNITGMAALVVGTVLVPWDWVMIATGWMDPVLLGVSHMVVTLWGVALIVIGFRDILDLSLRTSIGLSVVWLLVAWPLAAVFMRPPV